MSIVARAGPVGIVGLSAFLGFVSPARPNSLTAQGFAPQGPASQIQAACSGDGPASGYATRDSAGVRIIENSTINMQSRSGGPGLSAQPSTSIGTAAQTGPNYEFVGMVGTTRFRNGDIAIADSGTAEVRVFDSTGRFLRRMGRRGDGPGELQSLRKLIPGSADTILMFDPRARQARFFSSAGAFVRNTVFPVVTMDVRVPTDTGVRRIDGVVPIPIARFDDGSFLLQVGLPGPPTVPSPGVVGITRRDVAFLRQSPRDAGRALIFVMQTADIYRFLSVDGWLRNGEAPFSPPAIAIVSGDRILSGNGRRFEIQERDTTGRVTRLIRVCARPQPLARSETDGFAAAVIANTPAARVERTREEYRAMVYPTLAPAFGQLLPDPAGGFWVGEYRLRHRPLRWYAFDRDGRLTGSLPMPAGFTLMEVGRDYVLGVLLNRDGSETAHLYRLNRL